jgi:hypothetical protein
MTLKEIFVSVLFVTVTVAARASVIVSSCPVEPTDTDLGSHTLSASAEAKRSYEAKISETHGLLLPPLIKVASWFLPEQSAQDLRPLTMRKSDDLRLVLLGSDVAARAAPCKSTAQFIKPTLVRYAPGTPVQDRRVRFHICTYFVDDVRQIEMEGECRLLHPNRPDGFTLNALDARLARIDQTAYELERLLQFSTTGVGAAASLMLFRVTRPLGAIGIASGGILLIRTSLAAVPLASLSHLAWNTDQLQIPIKELIELRDAAATASRGRIGDEITVGMPIEDFEVILEDYLNTITPEDEARKIPLAELSVVRQ